MTEVKEIPRYKCLKSVRALQIRFINPIEKILMFEEDYPPIQVDEAYLFKYTPHVGGYFVIDEDGYQSFSPIESFETGHKLIK